MYDEPLNPLVEVLVGNGYDPPDVVLLRGFVGNSDRGNFVRVYLDPRLRTATEVPRTAVRFHQRFPQGDSSALVVDALWVDRGTTEPWPGPNRGGTSKERQKDEKEPKKEEEPNREEEPAILLNGGQKPEKDKSDGPPEGGDGPGAADTYRPPRW